ncbi:hypothetical protein [uncultured Dokdonia sp.]|uniref:hypothetical protein n=1 Tax=uncultured Dokdonia sp. TaxID=575653 RepID=UPI00262E9C97|nr:hypothetical protein [uncultured Dokdonia sp.]
MSLLLALTSVFFDVEYTSILFVIYMLFLFLYHYKATEKFNVVLLIYLVAMLVAEVMFLYDFEKYINVVSLTQLIGQMCFFWLIRSMLKVKFENFSTHNLIELIIGFIGISYVIGYLLYLIFPLIPDLTLFLPSVIVFFIMVTICIGIPFFNKHPDNIMLWGIGGGLIGEMSFGFIFEYISDHKAYLVMAHIFGAFLKIIFTMYLIRIKNIKKTEHNYN